MPSHIGILIDQHLDCHRCQRGVQRLDGGLFDILPRHISPLHQRFPNRLIGMLLTGDLNGIDAVEAGKHR